MAQAQTFDFAIAAQPVRQTLNEIARVTGLAVVYEETAAASVAANPVSGRQSASGAIDSALAGTGLAWRQTDAQTITISAPEPAAGPVEGLLLDTLVVTAAPGTTTEDTGSWTTEWMRSATGLQLTQKEIGRAHV